MMLALTLALGSTTRVASSFDDGPVNTVAPAVTGSATRGNLLTTDNGTWDTASVISGYTYQWTRDGGNIAGATSNTYTTVAADDGTLVACTVTATNNNGSGTANSNSTRILGEAVNNTVPAITGTTTVGETLSLTNPTSYWYAAPTLSFTYQWKRDTVNISGATSATYTLVADDYNTVITCAVTGDSSAFVGVGDTVTTAGTSAIVGLAPSNSVAPVISASGTSIGDTITLTSEGTWAGSPAPTLASRQWQRNGVDIPGETATTYTIVAADDNASITCDVTYTNIYGSTEASSNGVSVDDFVAPDFGANVPTISGTAQVGQTLTVSPAAESTVGVPATTTNYVWRYVSDNTQLQSSSSTTYTIQAGDVGEQIDVEQTNTNAIGSDSATSTATAAVTIVDTDFVLVMETTSAGETVTIPAQNVGTFDASIDWGDGSSSSITAYNDANLIHTYATAGEHTIRISGTFPNIYFNNAGDKLKVKRVEQLGVVGWTQLDRAFWGCSNMTSFVSGTTDTSSVTTMSSMFRDCSSATTLDVSSFNTSSVTGMGYMFNNCSSITTLDVSSFNTSSVTAMSFMFDSCSSLTTLDVSSFNTSSVVNMFRMFFGCSSLTALDVSSFDTSSVTNISYMFSDCASITTLDVSSFNTSSVVNMRDMFKNCSNLGVVDISGWNVANVTNGTNFMLGANNALDTTEYDQLLVAWEAQPVQSGVAFHFGDAQYTSGSAADTARTNLINNSNWTITDGGAIVDTDFVLVMETTSAGETITIPCQNVGTFNANIDWGDGSSSSITAYNDANLTHTYATAGEHTIRISGTFPNIYFNNSGDKDKVKRVEQLGDVGWVSLERAFYFCSNMTSFVSGTTDTSNVTNMSFMFYFCTNLTTVDVSSFDTSSVTNMSYMFGVCSSLNVVDISGWDVSSVTNGTNFMASANNALDTTEYDQLLIAWEAQPVQSNVTFHFGDAQYTSGSAAETARTNLINNSNWTITDGGAIVDTDFVLVMETTSAGETITIPCQNVGTFNANIDWGDGSSSSITAYNDAGLTHTYATAGEHTIKISGTFPNIYFNGNNQAAKVKRVEQLGDVGWIRLNNAFWGCSNMTSFVCGVTDTSNVTDMSFMFVFCTNLTTLDATNLNTSSVTNMTYMFFSCSSLNVVDISGWDVSSVTDGFSFMNGANNALDTTEYDQLLVAWEAQSVQIGAYFHFGDAQYTSGSAAETARTNLVNNSNWTITDGGSI